MHPLQSHANSRGLVQTLDPFRVSSGVLWGVFRTPRAAANAEFGLRPRVRSRGRAAVERFGASGLPPR